MRGDGERILLKYSPVFKRRYAIDGGFVLGCTIGCKFCYYRWIDTTREYFVNKKIKVLANPEEFLEFIDYSKIIEKDRDIIIIGAQNDASVQEKYIKDFLEIFPYKNPVLLLHRQVFDDFDIELLKDERVYLGTTITPSGRRLGWTPVDDDEQIKGIERVIESGVKHERIPIEVGPINEENIDKAIVIIKKLKELGFKHFIFRGCSIGSFKVNIENDLKELSERKFISEIKKHSPLYIDNKEMRKHEFYVMKNYLKEELEKRIYETAMNLGMIAHRITATYYRDVIGSKIARNRHNRVRFHDAKRVKESKIESELEYLGFKVRNIEWRGNHFFIETDRRVTEDIAMYLGCKFETAVIFKEFTNTPDIDDIIFYYENDILALKKIRYSKELLSEIKR